MLLLVMVSVVVAFYRSKHRSAWSMVTETTYNDPDDSNMYTQVLNTAEQLNDGDMLTRLRGVTNGDLVAIEARYHRKGCV